MVPSAGRPVAVPGGVRWVFDPPRCAPLVRIAERHWQITRRLHAYAAERRAELALVLSDGWRRFTPQEVEAFVANHGGPEIVARRDVATWAIRERDGFAEIAPDAIRLRGGVSARVGS